MLLFAYDLADQNGLDLARSLRVEYGNRLPMVLVTRSGSEALAARALYFGLDAYLSRHEGYLYELAPTLENVHKQARLIREERRLRETTARLGHLLATSPTLLYTLAIEAGHKTATWTSDNIERLLGFSAQETLVPAWWPSHIHPGDLLLTEQFSARILRGEACWCEYRFADCDGRYHWVRDEVRASGDVASGRFEVVGSWTDITPLKLAETIRQARATVLDQLVAQRPLKAILEHIVRQLQAIEPGMRVSVLLIDPISGLLTTGAAPDLPAFYNTAAAAGEMVIVEDVMTHPHWAAYRELAVEAGFRACWSVPFRDDSGKVVGTFGVYHDVPKSPDERELALLTEFVSITALAVQKSRSAEALRQAAAVFESTRDGVVITALDGRIVAVNRAYTEITGYTADEVVGRNPSISRSGRHDRSFYQAMWNSLQTSGHWQGEVWNRRRNGEVYPQWLTISTVRDEHGDKTHYVGVMTDLTQLKRSEAQLEHLSHYDPLTDLPNRLLVKSRLEHALEQARRHGHRVGVLYIDLDRFKNVNDSLGHPAGDAVLVEIATRLRAGVRREDTLARLGGDEFLVIVDDLPAIDDAALLAHKLIATVERPVAVGSGVVDGGRRMWAWRSPAAPAWASACFRTTATPPPN